MNAENFRMSLLMSGALIALAVVIVVFPITAIGSSYQFAQKQIVTVTATGFAYAAPDSATINLYVNATSSSPSEAASVLNSEIYALNSSIEPFIGNNASNIQTTSYSIGPSKTCTSIQPLHTASSGALENASSACVYYASAYPYYCCKYSIEYVATESIKVDVDNINNVGHILDAVSGISGVSVISVDQGFSNALLGEMSSEALKDAVQNATAQAQAVEGGRQIVLGNVTIMQNSYAYPVFSAASAAPAGESGNAQVFLGYSSFAKQISATFFVEH